MLSSIFWLGTKELRSFPKDYDGTGCLDGFREGISERLVAGCWFPLSPKSNSSVL